jgi:hypothetical protein
VTPAESKAEYDRWLNTPIMRLLLFAYQQENPQPPWDRRSSWRWRAIRRKRR